MKRLLCAFLMLLLMPVAGAFACAQNEIDVNGDGTLCETAKFTVTTTELAADTTFAFYMSARGTFYVDWGDGTVDTITRTDTDETLYDHTYSTAGVKTIRFGGIATGYYPEASATVGVAAIRFGYYATTDDATPHLVASIDGSLWAMFPYLTTSWPRLPMFYNTFAHTNITSIPENLFFGFTEAGYSMFRRTFANCTYLTDIPENLFKNIHSNSYLFRETFANCTALQSIPEDLFKDQTGYHTLFYLTFDGCTALQSIPAKLFQNIRTAGNWEFYSTFRNCTSLQSIPENLFAGITNAAAYMFRETFSGCTGLHGYIPPSLFAGLNNSGKYSTNMMNQTFYNTNLDTTCPAGTVQFVTGYEDYWDGHVSCVDENFVCAAGEYLPAHGYECTKCPENNYCVGGTYTYSENTAYGATQCPNSWYAPRGMSSADQCGRILHIGENVVYLRNVKKTTPSLNVRVDGYTFYGNMTTADVPMNAGTTAHMKVQFNNETYSIYDDTVTPSNYLQ